MNMWVLLSNVEKDIEKRELAGGTNAEYLKIVDQIKVIRVEKMKIIMNKDHGTTFVYDGKEVEAPDIFWPMISNSDGYTLERMLLRAGAKCFVDLDERAASRSKILTYQRLSDAGIRVPRTVAFFGKPDLQQILKELDYPFVIKPDNGFGGQGVELIHSEAEFEEYVKGFTPGIMYVAQEYVATSKGRDVRVIMVKGRYRWSSMRQAGNSEEFRSNIHVGGSYKEFEIDEKTEKMCEKVAGLFNLPLLGIDLMFGEDEFVVTEVNSFPGLSVERIVKVCKELFGTVLG